MPGLLISKMEIKLTRTGAVGSQTLDLQPLTVFVGPNNSGKSLALREINQRCTSASTGFLTSLIGELTIGRLTVEELEKARDSLLQVRPSHFAPDMNAIYIGRLNDVIQTTRGLFEKDLTEQSSHPHRFISFFLRFATLMMTGETRFNLVRRQPMGDVKLKREGTTFQALITNDEKRSLLRRIVYEALGIYIAIDPTDNGQLALTISRVEPTTEERRFDDQAIEFFKKCSLIDFASDGVKAFVGMLCEIVAGEHRVILVDEPEAFLHPPLAGKLGSELAQLAAANNKNVFCATHNVSFLVGALHSGVPMNIVRLTHKDGVGTARILTSSDLIPLMRNPLLRSSGVLNALFYESVVVTESDTDRVFYQEVNERLLRYKPEFGIPNCLFLNAQNKQTTRAITGPLRNLGIPAASIVDVDVVKDGGSVWMDFLKSGGVPEIDREALGTKRSRVKDAFLATGRDMKREGGVSLLQGDYRLAADNLYDELDRYGLFAVRGGEIESWYPAGGTHGTQWLHKTFEDFGEDPENPSYMMPSNDGVWLFMSKIRSWLLSPNRVGIPT